MYYVYVLKRNNKFYIGSTKDLRTRFDEHKLIDINCKLLYYEACVVKKLATARELSLKQYGSAWTGLKKRLQ